MKKSSTQLDREIAEALADRAIPLADRAIPGTAPSKSRRARKTRDIYVVQGNYGYGHGWEDVTAEETRKEALARLREYRENEPGVPFRLIRRRERIEAPTATAHARKKKIDHHEAKRHYTRSERRAILAEAREASARGHHALARELFARVGVSYAGARAGN